MPENLPANGIAAQRELNGIERIPLFLKPLKNNALAAVRNIQQSP